MTVPGERRPPASPPTATSSGSGSLIARLRPRSLPVAVAEALLVALVAALAWASLKGILELTLGLLAVAAFGGWAIGAITWQVRANPLLAMAIAAVAWFVGLVCTWLVAMALIPASTRTFFGRLEATPFLEWQSPQFGLVEIAGLLIYVGAALYGARPRSA